VPCRAGCSGGGVWCWRDAGPLDWHRRGASTMKSRGGMSYGTVKRA
jgi:hypothetical protein